MIEVTDGWYSINAILDEALTQHMALGKIYPGLKLRVIGARVRPPPPALFHHMLTWLDNP